MDKSEIQFEKRLIELSRTAENRNSVVYSDFLNINEQNILHSIPKNMLYSSFVTFGGYALAERQMVAFLPDDALSFRKEDEDDEQALWNLFCGELRILHIEPVQEKFAEELTHRDYLGAILNLGVDRRKTGDILCEGKIADLFVSSSLIPYLTQELIRVRHTNVSAVEIEHSSFIYEPKYEEIKGSVASLRLDNLIPLAFSGSRSRLSGLIREEKVFVNGKLITSNSYPLKEGDIVSVRGYGKFQYDGVLSTTKKNRIYVMLRKYV